MPWLINAAQLDKFKKSQKNVVILDASWHLNEEGLSAKEAFLKQHIHGARFFDFDLFHDKETALPNMISRNEAHLVDVIGKLGISNETKIIFYDNSSHHSSCRALWMFKVFGHSLNQLYILDGGYKAWQQYDGKYEEGEARVSTKTYQVNFQPQYIRTLVQMKTNLHHPTEQVIDMRHPVRFAGGAEKRAGLRRGHIPGSFSFPYFTMFTEEGRWKPIEKIRKQLMDIAVDLHYPIISTCGSGMSAAILNFALDLMHHPHHALYDGSWSEWASETLYPGETSLAERPVKTSTEN